jgi:hypothetical protein
MVPISTQGNIKIPMSVPTLVECARLSSYGVYVHLVGPSMASQPLRAGRLCTTAKWRVVDGTSCCGTLGNGPAVAMAIAATTTMNVISINLFMPEPLSWSNLTVNNKDK